MNLKNFNQLLSGPQAQDTQGRVSEYMTQFFLALKNS